MHIISFFLSTRVGNSEELLNLNSRSAGSLTPRALITLAAILVGVTGLIRLDGSRKSLRPSRPVFADSLQIGAAYGRLPLSFEPNQGQLIRR